MSDFYRAYAAQLTVGVYGPLETGLQLHGAQGGAVVCLCLGDSTAWCHGLSTFPAGSSRQNHTLP